MKLCYATPLITCFANDNDAMIPELWAQESLAILESNMVMARLVHRDFSNQVAQFGDVVNTRKPDNFAIKRLEDQGTVANQDASVTNVAVPLDQHVYVSFKIFDGEQSKSFQELVDIYLKPAASTCARAVDRILISQAIAFKANQVGSLTEMSSSTAKTYMLDAREKLNENNAYPDGRKLVMGSNAETNCLKTDMFLKANERGDGGDALTNAALGRVLGFDTYMDQNTPYVATTASAMTYNTTEINAADGFAVGTTGLILIDPWTVNTIVTVGEYVWFEGEGRVHEILVQANDANTTNSINIDTSGLAVALADEDAVHVFDSTTAGANYAAGYAKAVTVNDAVVSLGQLLASGTTTGGDRNEYTIIEIDSTGLIVWLDRPLVAAITSGDGLFPGPHGGMNLAFHRNALALVSRPLALPNTDLGARAAVASYNDLSMRIAMAYDISSQATVVTVDMLCGVKVLDANLGCLLVS